MSDQDHRQNNNQHNNMNKASGQDDHSNDSTQESISTGDQTSQEISNEHQQSSSHPESEQTNGSTPIKPPWRGVQVAKGIGLVILLHLLLLLYPVAIFAIGVVQLIYVIPALVILRKDTGLVQGILIATGITFLINAACFGLVWAAFN